MSNITKREKILLGLLIGFIVLFGYNKFLLSPTLNEVSEVRLDRTNKEEKLFALKNMKQENKRLKSIINKTEDEYKKAEKAVPIDQKEPQIENSVSIACGENNVGLENITFKNSKIYKDSTSDSTKTTTTKSNGTSKSVPGQFRVLPTTMSISGNYQNCIKFLKSLESNERICNVENISITSKTEAGVKMNLDVNYYFTSSSEKDKKNLKYEFNNSEAGKSDLFN